MKKANLSVVMPVYNSSKTVIRAIKSIENQTLLPEEIIIIDDKSTDNTIDIIKNYIEHKTIVKIELIELDINSGPSVARNTGWNKSNENFIAFLDSDDSWHPQKLELQYNYMNNNLNIKLSGHKMELCINKNPNSKIINNFEDVMINNITNKMLIAKNLFTTTSNIMINNDIKLRFDESMRYSEDYYLWLQICFENKISLIDYNLGYAYKDFTGVSGLSGNTDAMYKGSLLISKILLKEKKISKIIYIRRVLLRTVKFLIIKLKTFLNKEKNEL